ncbi:flagellin [Paracoccaceae bacterium]|nr:flagellin [Paracoccaceae bacterium]MDC0867930.1 flagellin [Paracoccaceae bacterium]
MALSVATNTGALMAQAAASSVNKEMEISMERLASGKRINGASDDAAGVAIASRLSSEIRGTNQAIRNAMDAQALIDTAEGAHDEIESILQRMRELAVQASNDTNNSNDRNNLQAEASALSTEINRIASTTTWAGENLLDATGGTSGTFEFQVGSRSSANDEILVSIGSMSASTLGVTAGAASTVGGAAREVSTNAIEVTGSVTQGDVYNFTVNGEALSYTVTTANAGQSTVAAQQAAVATGIAAAITTAAQPGLTSSTDGAVVTLNHDIVTFSGASADTVSGGASVSNSTLTLTFSDFATGTAAAFSVNGIAVAVTAGDMATATAYGKNRAGMVSAIEDKLAALSASFEGHTFTVSNGTAGTAIDIAVATRDGTATFIENVSVTGAAGSGTITLTSAANAQTAIGLLDTAINSVNSQRASLGAVSNRLDSTVSNLTNISSNLAAGRGRIEDADFAAETTNLAKTQILQQASTAMLAQANASKQNVLSLLQG